MTTKLNETDLRLKACYSAKRSISTVIIIIVTPHHCQLHLWMVSRGHLSNVWSQSSCWQPRPTHIHPTMTCFHHALSFLKNPENMSNWTLLLLWYVSLASQHRLLQGFDLQFVRSYIFTHKSQTKPNIIQPAPVSLWVFAIVTEYILLYGYNRYKVMQQHN